MEREILKIEKITYTDLKEKRLDQFLAETFPIYSRSYFQKLIKEDLVKIDGKPVKKAGQKIKPGYVVTVSFAAPKAIDLTPCKVDFEIVDIQPDFLIINKPTGLTVHPAASAPDETTLVHGLLHEFKEMKNFGKSERPGIVHRLDKNTSGLLIVARNEISQAKLSQMFQERKIKKHYKAVVCGHPVREGKIDIAIGRHPKLRHKMACNGTAMRSALTFFSVEKYFEDHSLLNIQIITGRTHQIRVHMAYEGHPIVGDPMYGKISKLIKRQALCAYKCSFEYDGQSFCYEIGLPMDIKKLMDKI
ncbi:RluA family pseudouridine synthase [Candidatus Dependentiae bacterium]